MNIPDKIYLQVGDGDGDMCDAETTWCRDQINDSDVAYLRLDPSVKSSDLYVRGNYEFGDLIMLYLKAYDETLCEDYIDDLDVHDPDTIFELGSNGFVYMCNSDRWAQSVIDTRKALSVEAILLSLDDVKIKWDCNNTEDVIKFAEKYGYHVDNVNDIHESLLLKKESHLLGLKLGETLYARHNKIGDCFSLDKTKIYKIW